MAARGTHGRRRKAERRGRWSEYVAAAFLIAKGYRILGLRVRTPLGEIDIVARKGDLIAFVEVKARSSDQLAVEAVGGHSQARIKAASDLWLAHRRDGHALSQRYDIIAVRPLRLPRHFIDAF